MAAKGVVLEVLEKALAKRYEVVMDNVFKSFDQWAMEKTDLRKRIEAIPDSDFLDHEYNNVKALIDNFVSQQPIIDINLVNEHPGNKSVTSDYVSPTKSEMSDFDPSFVSTPIKQPIERQAKRRLVPSEAGETSNFRQSKSRSRKSPKISPIKARLERIKQETFELPSISADLEETVPEETIAKSKDASTLQTSSLTNRSEQSILNNGNKRKEKFECGICNKGFQERAKFRHIERCIQKHYKDSPWEYYCKSENCDYKLPKCSSSENVVQHHLKSEHEIYEEYERFYDERTTGNLKQTDILSFFKRK